MNELNLQNVDYEALGEWAGFLSFRPNFILDCLQKCESRIIFIDTGNRAGKTASIVYDYILRIMGEHPIEKKNLRPNSPYRIIRFASEKLPLEPDSQGEIQNTVYPQLKKFLPPSWVKKDITIRKPVLTLYDPQGGPDVYIEFSSYGQTVQSQAGVDRFSIYLDEESPKSFYEEQLTRLINSDGDMVISLTPIEYISWSFDELYQRAKVVYNSPAIIKFAKEKLGKDYKPVEITDNSTSIGMIRAATDDNPVLDEKVITDILAIYDDDTTRETRRYGIFHQISGIIFKEFDKTHVISRDKYFPDGMSYDWFHARGIDFHEHTNWACGFVALSPENEAFIYEEFNPSPDRMITLEIAREVIYKSKDYKYKLNLIDPWADKTQPNTGLSPLDDINRIFMELKREGVGTGGYWQTWDTKSLRGRDIIRERLKNSRLVGKPFNNRTTKNGVTGYLPTIWVLDNCIQTIYQFKNWRWEQWSNRESNVTKEEKNKPEDKNSHFPVTYECIFKHPAFSMGRFKASVLDQRPSGYENYMRQRT